MLTINLLPDNARKAPPSAIEQFHRTPLMWLAAVMIVGYAQALFIATTVRRQQVQRLNAKIQTLLPKKSEADYLQRRIVQLRTQETALRQVRKKEHGLWSKRLYTLAQVMPEGVWFSELTLDPEKGLIIQGSAIGQGGTEMVHIGRFVQELKSDADFTSAFREIQIESIKRVPGEVEIVQFTLTCPLKERSKS